MIAFACTTLLTELDEWLENTATITAKVSDVEYVRADDIKKFKSELIFNLGVNQRILCGMSR